MLYGVLLVQLCEISIPFSRNIIRLAYWMIKMYTPIIFQEIGGSSGYWARHSFTDDTILLSDSFPTVYTIFSIETLQTVLTGVDLYNRFATGFGSIDRLTDPDPNLTAFDGPIIGSVVTLTVQFFFAYRVWILSERKSWWLCMVICVVSRSYNSDPNSAAHSLH
jgi:hypothetical protein